jgi:hypothetical protein
VSTPLRAVLLHGPIDSVGINVVSQHLHPTAHDRAEALAHFSCKQNILTMARIFRAMGFKVCYSGWNEDRPWLEENSALFDCLAISDQTQLKSQDVRGDLIFPNNKEKFYYAAYQGLLALEAKFGADAVVLRLRSDVLVAPDLALAEVARVERDPAVLLIECMRMERVLSFPDFMLVAVLGVMRDIYEGMYTRSRAGTAYHLSSHVDHSLTCIGMQQQGRLREIQAMGREIFDSVVWRGMPRYLEKYVEPQVPQLAFNVTVAVPADFSIERIVSSVPKLLAGQLAA